MLRSPGKTPGSPRELQLCRTVLLAVGNGVSAHSGSGHPASLISAVHSLCANTGKGKQPWLETSLSYSQLTNNKCYFSFSLKYWLWGSKLSSRPNGLKKFGEAVKAHCGAGGKGWPLILPTFAFASLYAQDQTGEPFRGKFQIKETKLVSSLF